MASPFSLEEKQVLLEIKEDLATRKTKISEIIALTLMMILIIPQFNNKRLI